MLKAVTSRRNYTLDELAELGRRLPRYPRASFVAGKILERRLRELRQQIRNGTFYSPDSLADRTS